MITFLEAVNIVKNNTIRITSERVPLSLSSGRFLAEDVYADRDTPPFNKSAVDGFACREEDLGEKLEIVETIPAGYEPSIILSKGKCSRIMTGAMIPSGADTVVMVEECRVEEDFMFYEGGKIRDNICQKGEDIEKGKLVISSGTLIGPVQVAILAAMGASSPLVFRKVKMGILSTGDEIIEPDVVAQRVQIRNSNGWQLFAQAVEAGADTTYLGIAKDEMSAVKEAISSGFKNNDVLIITGGVSMGDFDFVPESLLSLGFQILFDKVAVQPGKPSTFAVLKDINDNITKVVFALPGNPVSCLLQFKLLVKEWLAASAGGELKGIWTKAPMCQDFSRRNTARQSFIPGVLTLEGEFKPLSYNGSAHILAMGNATVIASIPIGTGDIKKGDSTTIFIL